MFRYRIEKRVIILSVIITIMVLFSLALFHLRSVLSASSKVNAEILVVEGWLPASEFKTVSEEFKNGGYRLIVTTGLETSADFLNLYSDGSLIFNLKDKFPGDTVKRRHSLSVRAFGSPGGSDKPRFEIVLNDSGAGVFVAGKRKRDYSTNWYGRLSQLDSLSVRFINYAIGPTWERTLFVEKIKMDDITIPYINNSTFSVTGPSGKLRIQNNYSSYATFARRSLIAFGTDSSKIIAVPCKKVSVNRTLASAVAFREWLKTNHPETKGINVMTVGVHGERTRMTYQALLHNRCNVGIIALPDYRARNSLSYDLLRTARETIEIAYYRIILHKYR